MRSKCGPNAVQKPPGLASPHPLRIFSDGVNGGELAKTNLLSAHQELARLQGRSSQKERGSWRDAHSRWRVQQGVKHVEPFAAPGVFSEREQDLLATVVAYLKMHKPETWRQYVVDVSQTLSRKPWALPWGTLTTSSHLFSLELQRLILAKEHFALLGFSPQRTSFQNLTESQLRTVRGHGELVLASGTQPLW